MLKSTQTTQSSIKEGPYLEIINQSKNNLSSVVATEEAKDFYKNNLLFCIEQCSKSNFNNEETLDEIFKIIEDNTLFNQFSKKEEIRIYKSLGDNYFGIGDMFAALKNYEEAVKLGDMNIMKDVVYISILLEFDKLDDSLFIKDKVSSFILNLDELEEGIGGMKKIKNEVVDIFYGNTGKDGFFEIGFDMIRSYYENNNSNKGLKIYNTLISFGFFNFSDDDLSLIGDIYLDLGSSDKAFSEFFIQIKDEELKNKKIKELLQELLLTKNFDIKESHNFGKRINDGKNEWIQNVDKIPSEEYCEYLISSLLEKIENNDDLSGGEMNKIMWLCRI